MKLEGGERLVLKTLLYLQGDSGEYVEDFRVAAATKMAVEDVRDWLETLEGKGFVERARRTDGFSAYVTAKGKQALRLTEPISTPNLPERVPRLIRPSRWYGGSIASARSHPGDNRPDPPLLLLLPQGREPPGRTGGGPWPS